MTTDNLWNRNALSLSRHLTGRRSFSRDPSKSDKLSYWVDQATPLQLAGRHTYPPLPLLPHMNQSQYIRPWRLRPEVCLPSKGPVWGRPAVWHLLLLLLSAPPYHVVGADIVMSLMCLCVRVCVVCGCVWGVGVVTTIKENPWSKCFETWQGSSPRYFVQVCWFLVQKVGIGVRVGVGIGLGLAMKPGWS